MSKSLLLNFGLIAKVRWLAHKIIISLQIIQKQIEITIKRFQDNVINWKIR